MDKILGTPTVTQIEAEQDSLIDDYIADICESVYELYEFKNEDEAIAAVFAVFNKLSLNNVIPEVPSSSDGVRSELIWLAKAKSIGLPALVYKELDASHKD